MALVKRIVQKVVRNDGKVPEIFFDAGGMTHTLKPGEIKTISAVEEKEVRDLGGQLKELDALRRTVAEQQQEIARLLEEIAALKAPAKMQAQAKKARS